MVVKYVQYLIIFDQLAYHSLLSAWIVFAPVASTPLQHPAPAPYPMAMNPEHERVK
jgi:hypothetical protein